jgi:RNA polymerase sigma-70 factor (ECF subfamily)
LKSRDQWFAEDVLPLEGALTAYLRRAAKSQSDVEDLRQEIYVRVYESGIPDRREPTGHFVFRVARNLLIDRLRRQRVVTIDLVADLGELNVISDELSADRVLTGRQELARLERAMNELPPRCREVFWLRKVEGLSQRAAADRLGVSQSTIEKQVIKAMRFLTASYFGNGEETQDNFSDKRADHGKVGR